MWRRRSCWRRWPPGWRPTGSESWWSPPTARAWSARWCRWAATSPCSAPGASRRPRATCPSARSARSGWTFELAPAGASVVAMHDRRLAAAVVAVALSLCGAACGSGADAGHAGATSTTAGPAPTPGTTAPAATTTTTAVPATAAPSTTAPSAPDPLARPAWLGTRVLPAGPDGVVAARPTPPELDPRHLRTVDVLPPPADGRFHATVAPVPAAVAARSSWQPACPVTLADLRYVTVSFWGFDNRAHSGELLVHRDAAQPFVGVFRTLFADRYPIEEMRVTSRADLDAPVTGDGNNTSAFACRPTRGSTKWSEHAFGKAVDVNPFQNPYHNGARVLPELATSYLNRANLRPGMITPGGPVATAFGRIGWAWGGLWHQPVDYMHFSADNR